MGLQEHRKAKRNVDTVKIILPYIIIGVRFFFLRYADPVVLPYFARDEPLILTFDF